MQRKALWESLSRRRAYFGTALLLASMASLSFPNALKGEDRNCNIYGPKGDSQAGEESDQLLYDEINPELFFEPEPEAESAAGCRIDIAIQAPGEVTLGQSARISTLLTAGNLEPGTPVALRYEVNFGDGPAVIYSAPPVEGKYFDHTYASAGNYTVTVNIYGVVSRPMADCRPMWNLGSGVAVAVKASTPTEPPDTDPGDNGGTAMSIRLEPGAVAEVNDDLRFTADGPSDPSYYYNWTFSDGITAHSKSFVRRFSRAADDYSVSLEVYKFANNAWGQVGATLTADFEVKPGLHVRSFVDPSFTVGPNRDMALSEFRSSDGVLHRVAWVAGAGKIAVVNTDNPDRPTMYGALRSVLAAPATTASVARYTTGHLAIAATDKLVALSDSGYGLFLFDGQRSATAPTSANSLVQVGRLPTAFAGDLCFDDSGNVLFAVNARGITAFDVSALNSPSSTLPNTYSPPVLASIGDGGYVSVFVTGDTLYAGQYSPVTLSVFALRDDNRNGKLDRMERIWQQSTTGPVDRIKMVYPVRAFAALGSLLAVNERVSTSYGLNSALSFFDATDPQHLVFRSRVGAWGTNFAGVALLDGEAYTMNSAVATEIDTSQSGAERIKEQISLTNLGTFGWGYRIMSDSRGLLFAGMSGAPLVVLDPNPLP